MRPGKEIWGSHTSSRRVTSLTGDSVPAMRKANCSKSGWLENHMPTLDGIPSTTVVGAGFIALDVLLNGNDNEHFRRRAGGTCGNVLAILSFLGFHSVPIARIFETSVWIANTYNATRLPALPGSLSFCLINRVIRIASFSDAHCANIAFPDARNRISTGQRIRSTT